MRWRETTTHRSAKLATTKPPVRITRPVIERKRMRISRKNVRTGMQDSDAQKSEVHEPTDDASSSPSSNVRQHAVSPPQGQGATPGTGATRTDVRGVGAPADNFERGAAERTRTNVA